MGGGGGKSLATSPVRPEERTLATQGAGAHKRDLNNLYQVIYYGDSQVEVGKPFSISCIISIANPVEWHKDGEPIRKHSNIRHGKDEHSYIESEMGIAGNRDKIEASISVQRALPKHQGRYQCNALYKNYHQLYVLRNGSLLSHVPLVGSSGKRLEEPFLGTARSTLVAPLAIDHHHFTTAVALAPAAIDRSLPSKEDLKRFVVAGQKESPDGGEDLRLKEKEELEQVMSAGAVHGVGKHPAGGRQQHPPPPLIEAPLEGDEEEEEEEGDERGASGVDLDDSIGGSDREEAEGDMRTDTEIVIDGKALSIEEDNIDKLIQNKSDISGIIRVDSLEELQLNGNLLLQQRPENTGGATVDEDEEPSTGSDGALVEEGLLLPTAPHIPDHTRTSLVAATPPSTTALATTTPTPTTASTTTTPRPPEAPEQQGVGGGHHRQHHHHEHHTTLKAAANGAVAFAITTTSATITTTAAADVLQPNYDDASTSLKIFDLGKALTLGCNVTKDGSYELSWSKDGKNVSEIESLKGRYNLIPAERKFIITRALETDAGVYTCSVHQLNASKNFTVVANVVVKFESTEVGKTNIVEGEKLTIRCIAYGTDPKITWTIGNNTYNASKDRIVLQEDDRGVENAVLTIDSITLDDYTDYTCEARNNATDITGKPAQVAMTVRVRGKYAALYVFLGIIAEVVVLCAIILICEKRRNKTEIEESDTDQSPDQTKNGYNGKDSELRQRK
ncbi:uncharacterized protein LOC128270894 [Anopheles cruzii]|uniref:uncharacterized protein LOC128270894 n=1 Tax=Anopheles cruzii TaxID=68878 RepID=UPI0022EC573F|nr:uncharacterized protein LOC128270894 [Anopheles cruzii]